MSRMREPSRRAFIGMLGAAVTTVAAYKVGVSVAPKEIERSTWSGVTRWIGHC